MSQLCSACTLAHWPWSGRGRRDLGNGIADSLGGVCLALEGVLKRGHVADLAADCVGEDVARMAPVGPWRSWLAGALARGVGSGRWAQRRHLATLHGGIRLAPPLRPALVEPQHCLGGRYCRILRGAHWQVPRFRSTF